LIRCGPVTQPSLASRSSKRRWLDQAGGARICAASLAVGVAAAGLASGASLRRRRCQRRGIKATAATAINAPDAERLKKVQKMMADMKVTFLGDEAHEEIDTIPTGVLGLDMIMGGGWPRGRIAEVYGPEASGKTTLALHAIAEVHKAGGIAAFVDVEHALDREYCKTIGVDIDRLVFDQPDSAEDALQRVETFAREGLDLVVLDSVAALAPREEIEKGIGEATIGLVARLMSKALRKITPIASRTGCTVLFINQLRANIGGYGLSEVTTGGRALKYAASMRAEVRAPASLFLKRAGGEAYGMRAKVKVTKNKIAPPHKSCEFDIIWGQGVSKESCVLEAALTYGIVEKRGAWLSYGDVRKQGREHFAAEMRRVPALCEELAEAAKARASGKLEEEDEEAVVAEEEPEGLFEVRNAEGGEDDDVEADGVASVA